jgi:hypothetical protein
VEVLVSERVKRPIFRGFPFGNALFRAGSKYFGKWCSNPFALTIYVNAAELHFSPLMRSRSRHVLHKCETSFHLRGQEICVCLNGWVTFLSKRRS